MISFAVTAPLEREDELAVTAVRHGHRVVLRCASADELIARLGSASIDAVLVDPSERHLTRELVRACDKAGVRMIAIVDDDAGASRAAVVGVESVRWDAGFERIEQALRLVGPAATAPSHERGVVTVVWGPHGAPGRTTTAIGLASELAAEGQRVVLVDADTHGASIAPALSLLDEAPGFAAAARLTRTKSLDDAELERVSQLHSTAFGSMHVLTGIARSSRWPELGAERVADVLEACRGWVDHVVVDVAASLESDEEVSSDMFAPRRNAATLAALRAADRIIAVGAGDPVGLTRFLRAWSELTEIVPADRIRVVMNKVRASAMGLAPERHVDQTLQRFAGIACHDFLPFDQQAADAAILSGRTLQDVAGRSQLRRRLHAIAASFLPAPEPTRKERRARESAGKRRVARAVH